MKFFNELILSIIMTALALGTIAGGITALDGPNDGAGAGAMAGGFAIAFAILMHGMMTTSKDETPKKDQAND